MVTLYIVVDTSYVYVESMFTSITIFYQLLDISITCVEIMMGLNDCDCRSHGKLICGYCLSFIRVLIIYLSITSSELIFYDTNQWIKQYFIILNDTFHQIQAENGKQCQSYRNIHCVSFDCILIGIMIIIWMSCCVYQLINHLVFQEMILLCHFIRIIIVSIVYSKLLCHRCNKNNGIIDILSIMVFIIV